MTKLKPIAMVTPNENFIYAPSRIQPVFEGNLTNLADTAQTVKVSFEADGVSNPQNVTSYGFLGRCIVHQEK